MSVNPELVSFGFLHVRWYGIMISIGLLCGYWLANRRASLYGFKKNDVADIIFWAMIGGLLGARALYVIRFWGEQFSDQFLDVFKIYNGGLVFLGGLAGAAFVVCLLCWIRHWALWRAADVLAPALALGHAFGRIGCLLNGCCHGFEYHGICSFSYEFLDWPTFPLQGAAFFVNMGMCLVLLWIEKHGKCRKYLFLIYMLMYSLCRFLLEFGRGDYPEGQLTLGLTPAQVTCLWLAPALVCVYGIAYWVLSKNKSEAEKKSLHGR